VQPLGFGFERVVERAVAQRQRCERDEDPDDQDDDQDLEKREGLLGATSVSRRPVRPSLAGR